jgi:NADH-quinone oxidoreductase subunit D
MRHFTLNFGPQHPAAHGILRVAFQMAGETIQKADPQFGLLHRGSEKIMEARNLLQSLPYFDRFDYVANLYQEHAYCLAIEALHLHRTALPSAVSMLRTFFDELSRIANHLLTLSAVALDMGSMGPLF